MSILPDGLDVVLGEEIYKSEDSNLVKDALIRLGVDASDTFQEFYNEYAGPFWEEYVPFELLDILKKLIGNRPFKVFCKETYKNG
ncbi:hypothetical protein PGC35_00020 [Psychrobacillus sp. PGGUH221]|uniref:hypothetical protein n=1 Tax=Psychrobacillus sp. PGGUH221 TaxID=3020058 RepID=UPI0035C67ABB